tara:strand:- start:3253 stop:4680 length:1428 start_codon:yes stop_codon:yes gene_type:complete
MSLNHLIQTNGIDESQLINIACKNLKPIGDLTITCDDLSTFNLKPPALGTAGQVLKSDGLGNTYFGNDTAGSSGVNYQGTNPVTLGTHFKISNSLGTEVVESKLIETSTEISMTSLNITNGGQYNATIINNGIVEATASNLELYPSTGNRINLNGLISAQDNKIINCLDPTLNSDVATKNYVDNNIGSGIEYTGTQPTALGELLIFNATDGSSVNKSALIESATNLNLGNLNITNVLNVDGVDVSSFKTSYDSNVNQDVRTNGNPTFTSITTNQINELTPGQGNQINTFLLSSGVLFGSSVSSANLRLNSNTTAVKGQIICEDELNVSSTKIVNLGTPTLNTDATNKLYVDTQISAIPTQVYDFIIPLTSEAGNVDSTGLKATIHIPRNMTITQIKASLTTAQTSGTTISLNLTNNGSNVLSVANSLTFINTQELSNQPALAITSLSVNDKLDCFISTFGDGTAVGLKITILGNI